MNAEQLKNSILQYAMQGKLVPQETNDEPASELVKRIKVEKELLISQKLIKREKALPEIIEDEIPFDIPESWEWVRASTIMDVRDGTHDTPKYVTEGVPLVTSKNLKDGKLIFEPIKYISREDHELIERRSKVENNDILFAMIGSIGNAVLVKKDKDFSIKNVGLFKAMPINKVNMEYIYHYLVFIERKLKQEASGAVQSFVSLTKLRQLLIPLPPLSEQEKIVKKINELNFKREVYRELHEKVLFMDNQLPVKLEKSILQYAMQGKLVEQNLEDEPARQLVERIKTEKERLIKEKVIKQEKTLVEISEDEIPFDIPKTWEWMRVKDVCLINPRNKADDEVEAGFIPMKLIEDGFKTTHTFEVQPWKEIKKGFTHFKNDDVVIAKITPCFENRKSVVIEGLPNNIGAGTTELYVVRPLTNEINNKFLLWLFKSHHFISNGVATYTGTAGQQRVAKSYVENYLIPIPPLNEQLRIVAALDKMHNNIKVLVN
ncbi:TPA: restriction endonuclease subunit S [Bacillus cereus]|nr:restriction endonuclease subunit S [Bacillus cereus]